MEFRFYSTGAKEPLKAWEETFQRKICKDSFSMLSMKAEETLKVGGKIWRWNQEKRSWFSFSSKNKRKFYEVCKKKDEVTLV